MSFLALWRHIGGANLSARVNLPLTLHSMAVKTTDGLTWDWSGKCQE